MILSYLSDIKRQENTKMQKTYRYFRMKKYKYYEISIHKYSSANPKIAIPTQFTYYEKSDAILSLSFARRLLLLPTKNGRTLKFKDV